MSHKPLSDQIRDAVNDSGMSRYRLCKTIGLSQAAMSRFMSGKTGLEMATLDRLADALGLVVSVRARSKEKASK
jgi:transcriptional regulator with XRE-family HTH domain